MLLGQLISKLVAQLATLAAQIVRVFQTTKSPLYANALARLALHAVSSLLNAQTGVHEEGHRYFREKLCFMTHLEIIRAIGEASHLGEHR